MWLKLLAPGSSTGWPRRPSASGINGDIPRFLANGDRLGGDAPSEG
jgi:hypothetical protein